MTKRYWILVAAIALAAAVAGMYLARSLDQPVVQLESGTALPVPGELAAFSLIDTEGKPVSPAQLRGHATLVFFGFTYCPDVCPTTLAKLASVQKEVKVPGLKVALITVDPERDTPEQLGKYISSFGGEFIGLTGSPPEIVKAQKSFGVAASRVELAGGGYTMDHSATVFLLDSQARKVAVFTPPLRADAIVRDLVKLSPTLGGAGS
ncbi:MAG TPA: SCO family protein [Steroidobacteraceae bacterium]|nr:SCO family protein [Steroidobacteraceae bacterium]